jgi:hypothetical protein
VVPTFLGGLTSADVTLAGERTAGVRDGALRYRHADRGHQIRAERNRGDHASRDEATAIPTFEPHAGWKPGRRCDGFYLGGLRRGFIVRTANNRRQISTPNPHRGARNIPDRTALEPLGANRPPERRPAPQTDAIVPDSQRALTHVARVVPAAVGPFFYACGCGSWKLQGQSRGNVLAGPFRVGEGLDRRWAMGFTNRTVGRIP